MTLRKYVKEKKRLAEQYAPLKISIRKRPIANEIQRKKLLDKNIECLSLSVRSHALLINSGIRTLEKLYSMSDKDFLAIKNCGYRCMNEIKQELKRFSKQHFLE